MNPITPLSQSFTFQSYFDNTLLQNAILAQAVGTPIVASTLQTAQSTGVAVALHPDSKCPVAIRFKGGKTSSTTVVLTPGQKVEVGPFDGFDWGLPFGWLGGGPVTLYVIGEGADISFPSSNAPVIFHRTRIAITNFSSDPAAPGTPNWPTGFPWGNANRGTIATPTPQRASPMFTVIPDITLLQYRGTGVTAPIELIAKWINVTGFDANSPPDQASGFSNGVHYYPVTIQSADQTAGGPHLAAPFWLPAELGHFMSDSAAFYLLDPSNTLSGQFVDVVRYGRFM